MSPTTVRLQPMTCIVAVAQEGRVWMGADSCGSDPSGYQIVGNPKIFAIGGDLLIGCCGSFRVMDLLRYSLKVERNGSWDIDRYMRTVFIDAVRECLTKGRFGDDGRSCSNFLVGHAGRLYEVQSDYSVLNVPDWGFAVGSGEHAARGSLWTTRHEGDPMRRVQVALEASEAIVHSVKGPFIFEAV